MRCGQRAIRSEPLPKSAASCLTLLILLLRPAPSPLHSKCRVIIYRYAGCDHMSCRCGRSFNWSQADRVGEGSAPPLQFHDLPEGLFSRNISGANGVTLQGISNTQIPDEGTGLSSLGFDPARRTGGGRHDGFQLSSIFTGLF